MTRRRLRAGGGGFDGRRYQERFDALAAEGADIHGEADFVLGLGPESVLDAGCGTGRVALELARRGVPVVGVDRDPSMLEVARQRLAEERRQMPHLRLSYVEADLAGLDLEAEFHVVVMAGNVMLFVDEATEQRVVASVASHVRQGGLLVAGFQLDRGYPLTAYDEHCASAGLRLVERYSTWGRAPFTGAEAYAVSVHEATGGRL